MSQRKNIPASFWEASGKCVEQCMYHSIYSGIYSSRCCHIVWHLTVHSIILLPNARKPGGLTPHEPSTLKGSGPPAGRQRLPAAPSPRFQNSPGAAMWRGGRGLKEHRIGRKWLWGIRVPRKRIPQSPNWEILTFRWSFGPPRERDSAE